MAKNKIQNIHLEQDGRGQTRVTIKRENREHMYRLTGLLYSRHNLSILLGDILSDSDRDDLCVDLFIGKFSIELTVHFQ